MQKKNEKIKTFRLADDIETFFLQKKRSVSAKMLSAGTLFFSFLRENGRAGAAVPAGKASFLFSVVRTREQNRLRAEFLSDERRAPSLHSLEFFRGNATE